MSPRNIRSYTHETSPAWLCKDQLNCEDSNTKVDGVGEPVTPQSHTENHRQLGNAEGGKNSLSQKREYQLVIQCQIVSPPNMHKSNVVIQVEQVVFVYLEICVCACVCVCVPICIYIGEGEIV